MNGVTFQPRGSLELRWSRQKTSKIFKERFFVFDNCPEDVLFGNPYIKKLRLVRYDWKSVLLDVWVTKPSKYAGIQVNLNVLHTNRQQSKQMRTEQRRNDVKMRRLRSQKGGGWRVCPKLP